MPPSKAAGQKKVLNSSIIILWSIYKKNPKILRIILGGDPGLFTEPTVSSHPKIKALADKIAAFLNGKDIRFPLSMLRLDLCSVFQQRVLAAAYAIPRGKISTYQLIAKQLGKPNAARAVGMALAANPFPLFIPCHRVIRSDGSLGGYLGGSKMKRALLRKEGR